MAPDPNPMRHQRNTAIVIHRFDQTVFRWPSYTTMMLRPGILLLCSLLASSSALGAGDAPREPRTVEAVQHLVSADRLMRLELPRLAIEHLLEIDHEALPDKYLPTYTGWIAIAIERHSLDSAHLDSLIETNTQTPRLQDLAATWKASLVLAHRKRRSSEILRNLDRILHLEASHENRKTAFMMAVHSALVAGRQRLQLDPGIQSGDLRAFIETWAVRSALGKDAEVARKLAFMEYRLDAESPEAEFWANRYIEVTRASPEALRFRGLLEEERRRPELALPWHLWSAHTAVFRSKQSLESWTKLGEIYRELGWCESADEAFQLAMVKPEVLERERPCRPRSKDLELRDECREWHDDLRNYSPERLVIQWRNDWQASFPDLEAWISRCGGREPNPFRNKGSSGGCLNVEKPLPRLAVSQFPHASNPRRILCALNMATFLFPELEDLFDKPWKKDIPDPWYWESAALFHLRVGEVERAVDFFEKSFGYDSKPGCKRLARSARALGESPLVEANRYATRIERELARLECVSSPTDRKRSRIERAEVEIERGREAAALPHLLEARRFGEAGSNYIDAKLVSIYSRLRWWDLALEAAARLERETPALADLEPGDLLPSLLPERCRALHLALEKEEADEERAKIFADWRRHCRDKSRK